MATDPRAIRRNKVRHVSLQVREAIEVLDKQRRTLVALFDLAIALEDNTAMERADAFEEAANCLDEQVHALKMWAIYFDKLG